MNEASLIAGAGNAIYAQPVPGDDSTLAYLETWQGDDGSNYVRITEGNLENIVRYTPDGRPILTGMMRQIQRLPQVTRVSMS